MNNNSRMFSSLFLSGLVASGIAVAAHANNEVTNEKDNIFVTNDEANEITYYTVKKGDSLYNICSVFYGDGTLWQKVAKYNNIEDGRLIHTNDVIKLPNDSKVLDNPTYIDAIKTNEDGTKTYTVQSGDNLTQICKNYYGDGTKTTAWKLATYNNLYNPNVIYTDQVLNMPEYNELLKIESKDYSYIYVKSEEVKHEFDSNFKPEEFDPNFDPNYKPDFKPFSKPDMKPDKEFKLILK